MDVPAGSVANETKVCLYSLRPNLLLMWTSESDPYLGLYTERHQPILGRWIHARSSSGQDTGWTVWNQHVWYGLQRHQQLPNCLGQVIISSSVVRTRVSLSSKFGTGFLPVCSSCVAVLSVSFTLNRLHMDSGNGHCWRQ